MEITRKGSAFLERKQIDSGRASIDEVVLTILADNRNPLDELDSVFNRKNIQTAISRLKRKEFIREE